MSIEPNTRFTLGNHPDGAAADPLYGLRIDGLSGDIDDVFTFNFAMNGARMEMDVLPAGGGDDLRIFGQAWGGLDGGDAYVDPQFWAIEFSYTDIEVQEAGGELLVFAEEGSGSGTITPLGPNGDEPGAPINLADEAGMHPFSFALARDHRGFEGISGFGWLNHDAIGDLETHLKFADWLFTAEDPRPIPEPNTFLLVSLGLGGMAWSRRRARAAPPRARSAPA